MNQTGSTGLKTVVFVAMLLMFSSQGAGWQEFRVFETTDDQEAPDVYGEIIVWQQFVEQYGDYDIYIADINNLAEPFVFVIGDANDQMYPAV